MNELRLIKSTELGKIKLGYHWKDGMDIGEGFVYAVEFGNVTKVGMTRNPKKRMEQLKGNAKYAQVNLGDMILSPPHLNYIENEAYLLLHLENRIAGTELFNMSLPDVGMVMERLTFHRPTEDEIAKFLLKKEKSAEHLKEAVKAYVGELGEIKENSVCIPVDTLLSSYDSLTNVSMELLKMLDTIYDLQEPMRGELFYKLLELYSEVEDAKI